jgi:hypothetical protein
VINNLLKYIDTYEPNHRLFFTLNEIIDLLYLKKCELTEEVEKQRQAQKSSCNEEDVNLINESLEILNDPLTSLKCVSYTIDMLNKRFDLKALNVPDRTATTLDIGDWDMNANKTVTVAHGLSDITQIVSLAVIIRDDAGNQTDSYFYTKEKGIWTGTDATNITLDVTGIAKFDGAEYDLTPFNRGFIDIVYNQ